MASATFKLDAREFNGTLARYAKLSRRERPVIVNTKAFYIARAAVRNTDKADKQKLVSELRASRLKAVVGKSGKVRNVHYNLAQLIIIARRAALGLKTTKDAIADDVKKLINARKRSIGFLKSGWLPAIRLLEPLADRIGGAPARLDKSAVQVGTSKGKARAALESQLVATAVITNNALPKHRGSGSVLARIIRHFHDPDQQQAYAVAEAGLQKAVESETASMLAYIEKKMKQAAQRAGVKTT